MSDEVRARLERWSKMGADEVETVRAQDVPALAAYALRAMDRFERDDLASGHPDDERAALLRGPDLP